MTSVAATQNEREVYLRALQDEAEARAVVQAFERALEQKKGLHRKSRAHLSDLKPPAGIEVSSAELETIRTNYDRSVDALEEILEGCGSKIGSLSARLGPDEDRRDASRRSRQAKLSRRRRERLHGNPETLPEGFPQINTEGHASVFTRDPDTGELRVYDVLNDEG